VQDVLAGQGRRRVAIAIGDGFEQGSVLADVASHSGNRWMNKLQIRLAMLSL
jgi:hypothetical protein